MHGWRLQQGATIAAIEHRSIEETPCFWPPLPAFLQLAARLEGMPAEEFAAHVEELAKVCLVGGLRAAGSASFLWMAVIRSAV